MKNECVVYVKSPNGFEEAVGELFDGDNDRRVFDDKGLFLTQEQRAQQLLM